jgi:hypothetical protein
MKLTTYPYGGFGSRSVVGGTIHAVDCSSTFSASWPPFTNSLRANLVTVERFHGSRYNTVIGCGTIAIGGGARRRSKY